MNFGPVLPYDDGEIGHTSGWSGSETSQERAYHRDLTGETEDHQTHVLMLLRFAGPQGMTWKEVSYRMGVHHGTASGLLSNLHVGGVILRLAQVRLGSKVYVLPEYRGDRDIERPRANLNARKIAALRRIVKQAEEQGRDSLPIGIVQQILNFNREG